MTNITFDNQVLKLYDSEKTSDTLTLKFLASVYPLSKIKDIFYGNDIKEKIKKIVKTTESGDFVCNFENYTSVKSVASVMTDVVTSETQKVPSLDAENNSISVDVPESKTEVIELIVVSIGYVDPIISLVEKLDDQINPTIDVNTCTLDELKSYTQNKNKKELSEFLYNNPLLWKDSKYYGVTKEDQEEMQADLSIYNLQHSLGNSDWKLKWHDQKKTSREFTMDEYTSLLIGIIDFVNPYRELQETYKQTIFAATTKDAILNLTMEYKISELVKKTK